jgi:hypothetical protein
MDNDEAVVLLEAELAPFREESYDQLLGRMSAEGLAFERVAPSGAKYQVDIQVFWDDRRNGNIRVRGSIDDGGWRAFIPLCRDFIKAPDGSFVGV